jgi:hypothetical protein
MTDTLAVKGFLSAEILSYQAQYRQEFAVAFAKLEDASTRATTDLFNLQLGGLEGVESRALLFWMKCVANCQAVFLLLEKGMATQAQILVRSAAEDLFFACALLKDESVLDRLAEEDRDQRRKQADGMLKSMKTLLPEQREQLQELIDSLPKKFNGIKTQRAAEIAGLLELYQTIFRGMSLVAAHGTLTSVASAVQGDQDDSLQLVFGPSPVGIEWTLGLATLLLEHGIQQFAVLGA